MSDEQTSIDDRRDPWAQFRTVTQARIGLERSGDGLPTAALLDFQLAHAHARDTVHGVVDFERLASEIEPTLPALQVHSAARDRATYLRRPDLGRRLNPASAALLDAERAEEAYDVVFVIGDGLSSAAVNEHALPTLFASLALLADWKTAPVVLAGQARVALGDEICRRLNARLCVILIGERPGLSVADSLGVYLTWSPQIGQKDSGRNCISNIHPHGLTYAQAAHKLVWLMSEAHRLGLTGVGLKENADGSGTLQAARPLSLAGGADGG